MQTLMTKLSKNKNIQEYMQVLNKINSSIQLEAENIATKLSKNKKEYELIFSTLDNLADYKKLYDYNLKSTGDQDESNYQRYKRKEEQIKSIFTHLSYSISYLKNGKYSSTRSKDNIRPKYQFLFNYRGEAKLFKTVYNIIEPYLLINSNITGIAGSNYLNPDSSSVILHYLMVMSLSAVLDKFGGNSDEKMLHSDIDNIKEEIIRDISPNNKSKINPNYAGSDSDETDAETDADSDADTDADTDADSDSETEPVIKTKNVIPDDEDDDIENLDLVRNINKQSSANLDVIIRFLYDFISSINTKQTLYDKLTYQFVENKVAEVEEKKTRENLQIFKHFAQDENMSEQNKLLMLKLNHKMIKYQDLYKTYGNLIGELGLDNVENVETGEGEEQTGPIMIEGDDEGNNYRVQEHQSELEMNEYLVDGDDD